MITSLLFLPLHSLEQATVAVFWPWRRHHFWFLALGFDFVCSILKSPLPYSDLKELHLNAFCIAKFSLRGTCFCSFIS